MAVARNVIEFALQADASGLVGPLQKVKGSFSELEQSAAKSATAVGGGLDKMQSSLSSAGNKMMGIGAAMTAATLPLTLALKSGLNALVEADRKAAQTAAVLKSTGGAANVSADQIKQMSSSLRDMSGVSGGTIREGANMLLTFTRIRNEVGKGNDVFDQATKATLDMSVAMGTDMQKAALQVGKALNDPIKGLTALQRVGIQFTDQQKEQIKGFMAVGDAASAQKVILEELNREFGGSAKAFGDSAAGQAAKLDGQLLLLKMTLAQELLPAFKVVVDQVTEGVKWFNSLDDGTKKWISTIAVALVAGGPILTGLGAVTKLVSGLIGLYGRLTAAATTAAIAEERASAAATAGTRGGALRGGLAGSLAGSLAGGAAGLLAGGGDIGAGATGAVAGGLASSMLSTGLAGPTGFLAAATSTSNPIQIKDTEEASNGFMRLSDLLERARHNLEQVKNEGGGVEERLKAISDTVRGNFQGTPDVINRVQGEMRALAEANGAVDVGFKGTSGTLTGMSTTFYTAEQSMQIVVGALSNLGPVVTAVATALGGAGVAAQSTGFNLNILNQELENSFDPWLASENAALNYQQALAGVDQAMKNKGTTELQAQQSMLGLESATRQHIEGLISQGASEAQIQAAIDASKGKLDELAAKYPGLTGVADTYKGKLQELIDKAHEVPPNKTVTVTADTSDANRKLDELKRTMASFYGTFKIPAPVPGGARGGVMVGGAQFFASGGVANRPTVVYGEGNPAYPEYFIATNPAYRERNRGLWQAAGAHLMAAGGSPGDPNATGASSSSSVAAGGDGAAAGTLGGINADATQSAAAAMGALTAAAAAYTQTAQLLTAVQQALDAQLVVSASLTFPSLTAATVADDLSTQSLSATVTANVPVQAGWQSTLGVSQQQLALTTAAVQALTASMAALNATVVTLHIEHSQVEAAGTSIQNLASKVSGALSSLGLSSNQLAQWLGVVLALPAGVLAGAVGAETGGVVGKPNVGSGFRTSRPTLVGEGNPAWAEYVIPTDPAHRSNAMSLLGGLHHDLGVAPLAMAAGGVVGKVGEAIAATTSNAMNTPWGGTGATAPGSLGSVTAGSMIAAAAASTGGSGSTKMVQFAMAQDGEQYVWGAEGPDAWDCSGLVLGAAAAAGLPGLPHYSGSQIDMATPIPVAQAISTPGAVLWHPGHIAISQGNGKTIEARGVAYGVGQWDAAGRFDRGGLLPFPGGSGGDVGDRLPGGWGDVGQYIADRFRAAGVGVGPSVAGEAGEAGGVGDWSGRISTFGGPNDPGARGGMAYDGTTVDAYYAGIPYAAMRLSVGTFQGRRGEIELPPRAWVSVAKGGASTRAQILDWGPGWRTGRLIDVAPYVADAIGANTDDIVDVKALAAGGKIGSYDSGGYLPVGWSLAYNGTGQPEPVIPAVSKTSGASVVVNITVEGSVTAESDLVRTITKAIEDRTRRGFVAV